MSAKNKKIKEKKNPIGLIISGLLLVLCCIIGADHLYDKYLASRYLVTAICLSIAFLFYSIKSKRLIIPKHYSFYIYLIYIVLCGITITWAIDFGEAIHTFSCYALTFFITIIFYGLLVNDRLSTRKMLWIASAVILVIYLLAAILQLIEIKSNTFDKLYNVSGINGHKNLLSIMLFVLSSFLLTSVPEQKRMSLKIITIALFIISIATIIFLKSRAAMLAIATASLIFIIIWLIHKRNFTFSKKTIIITTISTVVLTFLFLTIGLRKYSQHFIGRESEMAETDSYISTSSLWERCIVWDKTFQMIDKKPLMGVGVGNWQIIFPSMGQLELYRCDAWNVAFTKPHNEFLGLLSECGYIVFTLYLMFICSLLVLSFFVICKQKDKKDFIYGSVVVSIIAGCCVDSLFDFPSSRIEFIIWQGVLFAILFDLLRNDKDEYKDVKLNKLWNYVFFAITLLFITIGFFRFKGEYYTCNMQYARIKGNQKGIEKYANKCISVFYTIDPLGVPLHWYLGAAQSSQNKTLALNNLRLAHKHAPHCKFCLNDLAMEEYKTNKNIEEAEKYLLEAISQSPNYYAAYFNILNIYLNEHQYDKARNISYLLILDEEKRNMLKRDAKFFYPDNVKNICDEIDINYKIAKELRTKIDNI